MYANLGPGRLAELDGHVGHPVELLHSHAHVIDWMRRHNLYGYVSNNPVILHDPFGLLGQIAQFPKSFLEIDPCTPEEFGEVKTTLTEVCQFINGPEGEKCIGKRLRDCLKQVCDKDFLSRCIQRCRSDACAVASIYNMSPANGDTYVDTTYKHDEDTPCTPKKLIGGEKYVLQICLVINAGAPKGEDPGWARKGGFACGSSNRARILHELVHYCSLKHAYNKGTGAPEACERTCFPEEYDPKYWRFKETPRSCKCDC